MRSRWHSRGRGLYSQMHRGTGQDKVMQWLLAAGELKDAYLKEKIAYFISLGITSLRWLICTIKSTDMNWASAIRCWAVCWVQQYKSEWATVLAVQYWHPCRVSKNENRRGKQERNIISLGDSGNRGKGAYLQFRKTTRWRCENPQQEEASTMVVQRGLKVAMKAMVVFIRKTSMGSGSNKGGRAAGGLCWLPRFLGTAGGGAAEWDKEHVRRGNKEPALAVKSSRCWWVLQMEMSSREMGVGVWWCTQHRAGSGLSLPKGKGTACFPCGYRAGGPLINRVYWNCALDVFFSLSYLTESKPYQLLPQVSWGMQPRPGETGFLSIKKQIYFKR